MTEHRKIALHDSSNTSRKRNIELMMQERMERNIALRDGISNVILRCWCS